MDGLIVVVVVEGDVVQCVFSNDTGIDVVVIDHDEEAEDEHWVVNQYLQPLSELNDDLKKKVEEVL